MIEDKNKGITVQYNYLNSPTSVAWTGTQKRIVWLYDATGAKLRQTVYNASGGVQEEREYIGRFEYTRTGSALTLQHFAMSEGRVTHGTGGFEYEYFMKDHLGNVRMSFQKGTNGFAAKTQEVLRSQLGYE